MVLTTDKWEFKVQEESEVGEDYQSSERAKLRISKRKSGRTTGKKAQASRAHRPKRKEPGTKPDQEPISTKTKLKPLIMAQPLSARGSFKEGTEMKVPSTVIFWVEYYESHQRLIIAFRGSGKYYTYYSVPIEIFQAFNLAPSKGRYFNKHIKGKYNFLPGARRPQGG